MSHKHSEETRAKLTGKLKVGFRLESQKKVGLFRKLHPDKPLIVATKNVIEMMEVSDGRRNMEDLHQG